MPGAPFTTGVLAIKTRNSAGETVVVYLQHDHLKTPVQVIDKAGRVVWAASYEPFGRASVMTSPATNAPTIDLALRLPGQIEDAETGLHYNWHRYYDPETGRYVTRDPVGLKGGVNAYSYGDASPVMVSDPRGLVAVPIAGNWCGPGWTGGRWGPYDPKLPSHDYEPPLGRTDAACKRHDICYQECRDDRSCNSADRVLCFRRCDRILASEIPFSFKDRTPIGQQVLIYLWMRFMRLQRPND